MTRDLVTRASAIARRAHAGQTRKYTGEPYFNHVEAVARALRHHGADDATVAAAFLHDVLEDTPTTYADLVREFGHEVAVLVSEVTDVSTPADGNRAARKAKDRDHLAGASRRAQDIKLADMADNTRTIAKYDPKFAKLYLAEKAAVDAVMTLGTFGRKGREGK